MSEVTLTRVYLEEICEGLIADFHRLNAEHSTRAQRLRATYRKIATCEEQIISIPPRHTKKIRNLRKQIDHLRQSASTQVERMDGIQREMDVNGDCIQGLKDEIANRLDESTA